MSLLRLVLLRHAEAEEAHGRTDRTRTLTRRGEQQAAKIGQIFASEGLRPDVIVTSDAARTVQTTAAVVGALGLEVLPVVDKRLYLGGLRDIQTAIGELGSLPRTIIVVGHNPGWSLAVEALSDRSIELSTAEAADLTIEADDWATALKLTSAWELARIARG